VRSFLESRRFLLAASLGLLLALGSIANGYRVEDDLLERQGEAIASGIVRDATVDGSLRDRKRRTSVRITVDGVERRAVVFPDRAYVQGLRVRIAYLPAEPERIYIVGSTPWSWWAATRPLFALLTFVAAGALVASVVLLVEGRRWS
jgi:hypothetical protein